MTPLIYLSSYCAPSHQELGVGTCIMINIQAISETEQNSPLEVNVESRHLNPSSSFPYVPFLALPTRLPQA